MYARAQCREALEISLRDGALTAAGRRFLTRLRAELDAWAGDVVDAEAAELAALVADGHRAGWRIRHRRLDGDRVIALAKAWHDRGREPAAPPWRVEPDPAMRRWSSARLGLARRRLAAPGQYAAARDEPWGAALDAADLELFAGDPRAAARGFAARLGDDPEDPDAWTGLGLALSRGGGDPAAGAALLDRPELVRALHRELGAAGSPAEVAAWAGGLA